MSSPHFNYSNFSHTLFIRYLFLKGPAHSKNEKYFLTPAQTKPLVEWG